MYPGFTFGLANVKLPLAQLLYHFNWKLPDGKKLEDLDMSESFGATVKIRDNLMMPKLEKLHQKLDQILNNIVNEHKNLVSEEKSFKPERFGNSLVDIIGTNYEYIPFGAGRTCLGITFSLANVEISLAQLLYHFNWKIPHGMKPGD
ncbi:hypothetical protein LguiA_015198 [Lonicera macranthoides]